MMNNEREELCMLNNIAISPIRSNLTYVFMTYSTKSVHELVCRLMCKGKYQYIYFYIYIYISVCICV